MGKVAVLLLVIVVLLSPCVYAQSGYQNPIRIYSTWEGDYVTIDLGNGITFVDGPPRILPPPPPSTGIPRRAGTYDWHRK